MCCLSSCVIRCHSSVQSLFFYLFSWRSSPIRSLLIPKRAQGKPHASNTMLPPSAEHWFGTDKLGRDILSRIIMGARPALIIPIGVVLFAVLIGAPLGALAGYKGGWLDEVIMRITDLFLAFPSLLLAMAIASALGRGLDKAAIALVVSWWPWYTRIARGVTVSLKEQIFCRSRAGHRGQRYGHHLSSYSAEYDFTHSRASHSGFGHGHPGDGRAGIFGTRHTAAVTRLGLDGQRWPNLYSRSMVDRHLPRYGDLYCCACFQSAW